MAQGLKLAYWVVSCEQKPRLDEGRTWFNVRPSWVLLFPIVLYYPRQCFLCWGPCTGGIECRSNFSAFEDLGALNIQGTHL